MRFGNLEAEVKRIGLSVEEIGGILGYSKMIMYNRLNGKTNWTLQDMLKIQKFINEKAHAHYTLDYLFARG